MKILLVEDDAGTLQGMTIALRMMSHTCEACSDPQKALEKYKTTEYDVVITDICMPKMSGFTLGRMLRQWNPEAKILYISGQINPTFEELAEKDRAGSFLRKPIEFNALQAALDRIVCRGVE